VSRAAGRVVVRRLLVRGAEVRLFAAARAHTATRDRRAEVAAAAASCGVAEVSTEPELPTYVETLKELEAAAEHFARVTPQPTRRRRRRRRRS